MRNSGKIQKKESAVYKTALLRKRFASLAIATALLLSGALIGGCGDDGTSSGGAAQVILLKSTPSGQVNRGSTALVEAKVIDNGGNAVSGQRVTFTVRPTSLGYFTPVSDTTAQDGTVGSIFTATSTGTATIQATAGTSVLTATLEINDNTNSSGNITVTVTPLLMTAGSSDSANVAITANRRDGTPVADGTIIYLVAGERFQDMDSDGYFTEGYDSLMYDANANNKWDPIGTIPSTATTIGGNASVYYKAGNQATTVYIRATFSDSGRVSYAEVSAKLNPNTTVASITLTHNGEDLRVKGVGGIEFARVLATAYDEYGNTVPEGIPIQFTIANGPGGGENIQGEGYGPVEVSTNSAGQASVTVYSGTISGTIRVRATSATVLSAATQLVVNAGPPFKVRVGAEYCNLRSFDYINERNPVVAVVCDVYTNPVPDSTTVYFSCSEGCMEAYGLTGVPPNEAGTVHVEWISCDHINGRVWLYAETGGGTVRDSSLFISSGPSVYVSVDEYPSTLYASSDEIGRVVVSVRDINHNFVAANTPIAIEADFGAIGGGNTVDGCYTSLIETKYFASPLKKDYSWTTPDDGIGAVSNVRVVAGGMGGASAGFTTLFLTTDTYFKNCNVDIEPEMEPGTLAPFSITVKDRAGNPLGGHQLSVFPNGGTVTGTNYITNEYGEVNLFYQAPGAEGTYLITVTDLDPRGAVSFAKKVKVKTASL